MSTVKIGWGAKIAVLYLGFVAIIVTLVAGSMRQQFDLVSTDYYEQELKYQEVIDAGKNQAGLSASAHIKSDGEYVVISLPAEFANKTITGQAQFYSPVNEAWDKKTPITNAETIIARKELHTTSYTVKLSWTAEGKQYYQETKLNLSQK